MSHQVVVVLDVNQDWIDEMAPAGEWLGFLVIRVDRGVAHRAQVVNAYEVEDDGQSEESS